MAKTEKPDISPKVPEPVQESGCVVCGAYGNLEQLTANARVHKACADARPDVIAKVKARA